MNALPDVTSLPLTKAERKLLDLLLAANGEPVARADIQAANGVRPRDPESYSNPQDVLVGRLRKKLRVGGVALKVRTVRNVGYRLDLAGGEA